MANKKMATVHKFKPRPANPGNGARQAVQRYFNLRKSDLPSVDHFLTWLWKRGFQVARHADLKVNPLQKAWDEALPEYERRHKAAVKSLAEARKQRDPNR